MEDFRSKSCGHGRTEVETYNGGSGSAGPSSSGVNGMQDLRCYSASYASSVHPQQQQQTQAGSNGEKFRKGKSANGSLTKSWSLSDPELQRKKRVASYKVYTVEGKLKGSLRKSFRWLKETCNRVVNGRIRFLPMSCISEWFPLPSWMQTLAKIVVLEKDFQESRKEMAIETQTELSSGNAEFSG